MNYRSTAPANAYNLPPPTNLVDPPHGETNLIMSATEEDTMEMEVEEYISPTMTTE